MPAAIIATDSTDEHGFYFACGKKGWPRIGAKQTRKENACGNYRQRMARMNTDKHGLIAGGKSGGHEMTQKFTKRKCLWHI